VTTGEQGAYRTASPPDAARSPTWVDRLLCRITGHRWRIVRVNLSRATWLAHLHDLAGHDAVCTRCHVHWLDAEPNTVMFGWDRCEVCGRLEEEPCGNPPSSTSGKKGTRP
jgi:hypothetical protein